jgi:hypothetical protein
MPLDGLLQRRDKELATRTTGKLYKDLLEDFAAVRAGFETQSKRADKIMDYWDIYYCCLNNLQFYNGQSQIYVPIVENAIEARKTRFVNQIFPSSGRYIDATSSDEAVPHAEIALLESYIRRDRLKVKIAALIVNGDVEGQYNIYVDWSEYRRHLVSRETKPAMVAQEGGLPAIESPDQTVEIMVEEAVFDAGPCVEILHDSDVLVLPATADSIDEALASGGSVTILRRWSKPQLKAKIAAGELMSGPTGKLLDAMGDESFLANAEKEMVDAAGIKDRGKHLLVYETWKILDVEGEKRLCKILYGGYDLVLSCRRNPHWNDRCPLISTPVRKIAGSFKGVSVLSFIDTVQYHANDIANQAADSATYSMLPIVMSDPAKNPRTATMILNLAAIWECDPNSTRFAEFPKLWQDGIALVQADTQFIFQTLGVNPAMLPQQTGKPGAKRNQAEVALEQSVDLLTTAGASSVLEEGILTPMLERFAELDQQFRDDEIAVRSFGEMGRVAKMEKVPPMQLGRRFQFTWFGVEQARNAAQLQQQIAWLNVARGMQPLLQAAGYKLNPAPILEHSAGNIFGWRMGRQVLIDERSQLSVDPMTENMMLEDGFDVPVHPLDNPQQHIQAHMAAMRLSGDPTGAFRLHIQAHMAAMAAMAAQRQQMQQPGPGGGPGPPQPGAQPAGPRLIKGPPGMIAPDQMSRAGAAVPPRRA